MGPSGPWIRSSPVSDVLTLSQVSLRQTLHLTFPHLTKLKQRLHTGICAAPPHHVP